MLRDFEEGHSGTSARRLEALLDEFERSGLSGSKFSGLAGVCYQTFAGLRQNRRRARIGCEPAAPPVESLRTGGPLAMIRWLEVETEHSSSAVAAESTPESGSVMPVTVKMAGGVTVGTRHGWFRRKVMV